MSFLDNYLDDLLNEAKRTSRTVISRKTKIKRARGQLATVAARKKNDPIYKQMVKYRALYFKYRDMLHKKYSPRVRTKARR